MRQKRLFDALFTCVFGMRIGYCAECSKFTKTSLFTPRL